MKGIALSRIAALVGAMTLAAACSDSPAAPVTRIAADTTAPLLEVFVRMPIYQYMRDAALFTGGVSLPAVIVPVPASCTYLPTSKRFVCAPITSGTDTVTQSFALLDATGNAQSKFDATTTASIEVATTIIGSSTPSPSGPVGVVTLVPLAKIVFTDNWQQDMTISGLLTPTQLLNGTATVITTSTISGSPVFVTADTVRQTISGIALPTSNSPTKYPLSGSITTSETMMTAFSGLLPPTVRSYQMQMVFNGTSVVAMAFSDGSHCSIDLATAVTYSCD